MEEATEKIPVGKETVIRYAEEVLGLDMDLVKLYAGFNEFMDVVTTDFCYYYILDTNGNGYRIRWMVATDEITEVKFDWDVDEANINSGSVKYTLMEK